MHECRKSIASALWHNAEPFQTGETLQVELAQAGGAGGKMSELRGEAWKLRAEAELRLPLSIVDVQLSQVRELREADATEAARKPKHFQLP
mmetsp:Transcript_8683/g.24977  ORF Transcript_8683/g.24977 Transcript_8683/m.24977 type:complete len:91 (+) Transcript_8683:1104-1376(+)